MIFPPGCSLVDSKQKPRHAPAFAQRASHSGKSTVAGGARSSPAPRKPSSWTKPVGADAFFTYVCHGTAADLHDVRFAVVVKWHAHRVALSESRTSRSRDWRSAKSLCSATSESASGRADGVGGVAAIVAREANILGAGGIAGRSTDPPAR